MMAAESPIKKPGRIQAGSCQSHLGSQVGLPGSRHSRPGSNPGSKAGSRPSRPGSKLGSPPTGILGRIPPPTWDPRRDPACPARGPTQDSTSDLGSKAGSHLSCPGSKPGFHIPPWFRQLISRRLWKQVTLGILTLLYLTPRIYFL